MGEKLDFRSPELSKKMNRILFNFGKRYIGEKLNRLKKFYGIVIYYINPAYTFQECGFYGYIHNREKKGYSNIL